MVEAATARRGLALVFSTLLLDIVGIGIIPSVEPLLAAGARSGR